MRVRHTVVRVQHGRFPVRTHIRPATRVVLHHISFVVSARRRIVPRRTRRRLRRWRRRGPLAVVASAGRPRRTAALLHVACLVPRGVPSLAGAAATFGPVRRSVGAVPARRRGRRRRLRGRWVQVLGSRSAAVVRQQRRIRAHVVVLDQRLGSDDGSVRVARRMLSSVRPVALLVLSVAAALRRVPRLATHPAALLGTAGLLLHLGPGTRRTFFRSTHSGWSAVGTHKPLSRIHSRAIQRSPFTIARYTEPLPLPPCWIGESQETRPKRVTAVSWRYEYSTPANANCSWLY